MNFVFNATLIKHPQANAARCQPLRHQSPFQSATPLPTSETKLIKNACAWLLNVLAQIAWCMEDITAHKKNVQVF